MSTSFFNSLRRSEVERELARGLGLRARRESRPRRTCWILATAVLLLVPIVCTIGRHSSYRASIVIFPTSVGPYRRIHDPRYYAGLLADPELRRQMILNVGAGTGDYRSVRFRPDSRPRGTLLMSGTADTPDDATTFVDALAHQVAEATRRGLAVRRSRDIRRGVTLLLLGRIGPHRSRRVARRIRTAARLGPLPRTRVVLAPVQLSQPVHGWADRVADAMPGKFPARPLLIGVGLAGLVVAASSWITGLLLVPPRRPSNQRTASTDSMTLDHAVRSWS